MMSNKPNIVAIIQARIGSTRLPAKVLKLLYEKTLLEYVLERVAASRRITRIVVATTMAASDDKIQALACKAGVDVFRGNEDNVLKRFYLAAKEYGADIVVRVTSDNPFTDPEIIDQAVDLLINDNYEYCSNTIYPTYPEGINVEVFTFGALEKAYKDANLDSEKEHVTPFIWKNPERFRIHNFSYHKDLSYMRWTIDYETDLQFAREIYRRLYPRNKSFSMRDILTLIEQEPELSQINSGIARNEGYLKSMQKEG